MGKTSKPRGIMRNSVRVIAAVSTLSAAIALASANAASADPSTPQGRKVTVTTSMKVVGFDSAVAEQHGYKIVTLPNGKQTSVPKDGRVVPHTAPVPVIYGDCGESYIHFNSTGGNYEGEISTGYRLHHDVVRYGWTVDVTDRFGVGKLHDSGWATGPNHEMHFLTHSGGSGDAVARVEGGSYAILLDGEECYSGSPWDQTYYYKD
ncbi:hypothetical protein [Streptomyces sp. NPDC007856]|uniref:hypothetical protein n=1 Tax=Streptomyces sp. NPDC007856 TaxID=3364781 RepID=UPI003691032F